MKAAGRALGDFRFLSKAERSLLRHCRAGTLTQLDLVRPERASNENSVRAQFLRFLLLGGDERAPVHESGLQLSGAYIDGVLDLQGTSVQHAISLVNCTFTHMPDFTDAKISGSLRLNDSTSPGLESNRLMTQGMLDMSRFWSRGTISFDDVRVGGSLTMNGARLHGKGNRSLSADRLEVRGALLMSEGFSADGKVSLQGARIAGEVNCRGGHFIGHDTTAINLDHAEVGEGIFLADGFSSKGTVRCMGAHVDGPLYCVGATMNGRGDVALSFSTANIKGHVFLCRGFQSYGPIYARGATVDGQFNCVGADFDGAGDSALSADGIRVQQDVVFREGFCAQGGVRFLGARIQGQLICDGRFNGDGHKAFFADGVEVGGGVFLNPNFAPMGRVSLMFASVTGQLVIRGARFDGGGCEALTVDGMVIKGDLHLIERVSFLGEVSLAGTQIEGQLACTNGIFDGNGGCAFSASGLIVKNDVILSEGFSAMGTVRLVGAQIGGSLTCDKATLDGCGEDALFADRINVTGSVRMRGSFQSYGAVRFVGANVAGEFNCTGAALGSATRHSRLLLDNLCLAGQLILRNLTHPLVNASFAGVKVGVLDDDENTWGERIALNGFVYDTFSPNAAVNASFRVKWLDKQVAKVPAAIGQTDLTKDFRPQPWRQLQLVLQDMGHSSEAREIGVVLERRLREIRHVGQTPETWKPWTRWLYTFTSRRLHSLYGRLTGFGYRPMQLLVWFVGIWLACASVYWYSAARIGVFAPSNPLVFQNDSYLDCRPDRAQAWLRDHPELALPAKLQGKGNWYLCDSLREEYTGFSPLAYSLDVLMPLVDLQQESDWAPLVPTPKQGVWDEFTSFGWKHFVRLVIWFEILVGWGISLLMVAIVSGLARRSE